MEKFAPKHGFHGLLVFCEITGPYSDKLLRLARRMGHHTAGVSGEMVHRMKIVESNDAGKTDSKDARIMLLIGRLQKLLSHRDIRGRYAALREKNRAYDLEKDSATAAKRLIHSVLMRLFPDCPLDNQVVFRGMGPALFAAYIFDPAPMRRDGYPLFCRRLRALAPGIKDVTLSSVFEAARNSVWIVREPVEIEAIKQRLALAWDHLRRHVANAGVIKLEMEALGACGTKVMAGLERKLLRIIFSLGRRQAVFDPKRMNQCESQYQKGA